MTSLAPQRGGLHPSIVLSAYVEPFVRGRRVAIIGDATIGLAEELSQRGARLVHAYDPSPGRAAEALARSASHKPHPVSFAVFGADLGVRDGAFDVVVVPDLSVFSDAADVMRKVRRLCAPTGIAVFVAPNDRSAKRKLLVVEGEAKASPPPSYYELFDLVSLQFAKVRMVGQAPFVGYTVADFAPAGEPEVSVDTSLLASSEEPEHFIAIGSDRAIEIDPYAVIELPWTEVASGILPLETNAHSLATERLSLAEAQAHVALLTAELEKLREKEAARPEVHSASQGRLVELERELSARETKLREVEARAGDNHVRSERLTHQIRDLEEELRRQRDRGTRLSKQLDDEKKLRTKVEVELGMLRGRPEIAGAKDRLDTMTAELEAARSRIAELEHEQARRLAFPAPPPAPLPPPAVPDQKLLHRLGELEQALSAGRREANEAIAQRDAALARARQAEEENAKIAALEAQILALQHEKAALLEQVRDLEAGKAALERRIAAERDRATRAESNAAERSHRLGEMDRVLVEQTAQIEGLRSRLAERQLEMAALTEKLRLAEADRSTAEAATQEIARVEDALRERGRRVAELERDMRESERVGRELLAELEGGRAEGAEAPPRPASTQNTDELRSRLDALAESAARSQAELQSATWRIAQLERELSDARRGANEPSTVQVELEQALAAARDEVASLRRALGNRAS